GTAKVGVIRLTTGLAWLGDKRTYSRQLFRTRLDRYGSSRSYWEFLTPAQRMERGVPARLLDLDEVANVVVRLARDESLFGRVLVGWSDGPPGLISWGDRGYRELEAIDL